jgi:RNA polymerase sigma-32 factor
MKSRNSQYANLTEHISDKQDIFSSLKTYLHEISQHPLMTREEEQEVLQRARNSDDKEAWQKLVLSNLRLVVKIAIAYHSHLNLLDLIQEGNVGLLRAVKKFDPEKGTRFTTYAAFWIRAYMLKYLMESWSMVKIGTNDSQRKLFYGLNKEKMKLEKVGITPSTLILADSLETSAAEVEAMEQRLYHADISLEAPQNNDGDPLIDTIGSGEDIEETVIKRDFIEVLNKKLGNFKKQLNEKECFILKNRILAEDPLTLREIGERFSTSRESVRQIQTRISKRLAKNLRRSEIAAFI